MHRLFGFASCFLLLFVLSSCVKRTDVILTIAPSGKCRMECMVKIRFKNIGNQAVNIPLRDGFPRGLIIEGSKGVGPGCQGKRLEAAAQEMRQPSTDFVALKPWEVVERTASLYYVFDTSSPLVTECDFRVTWKYQLRQGFSDRPEGRERTGEFLIPKTD